MRLTPSALFSRVQSPLKRGDRIVLRDIVASRAGYTRSHFDRIHGLQVEYNAPDGANYLWYAGNQTIVSGRWRAGDVPTSDGASRITRICYLYGASTYDPADLSQGGAWECIPAMIGIVMTKERVRGDIFGLSRRAEPPFILPRDEASFSDLLARRRTGGTPGPTSRSSAPDAPRFGAPKVAHTVRIDDSDCPGRDGGDDNLFHACVREKIRIYFATRRKSECDKARLIEGRQQAVGSSVQATIGACASEGY